MYRALYRKWRPQLFADIVGQESITAALQNQITANKIAHAYMFTGSRGTGKTSCAKVFAKAVNCESPVGAEPCGQCPMCKGLEDGSILDVAEIDAASNNGVDDVRDLRDETMFNPSRGRFKVYIIDEVHMLTTQAFNALLKTLEEPPSHVIFILATTEIHKVPATILSRCQRFDFFRIPADKIAGRLAFVAGQENINLTTEAADLIARLADGAMRDALSLLDTCAGVEETVDEALVRRMAGVADKGYLFDLSQAAQTADTQQLMALVAKLHGQSIDVRRLCEELVFHYRNLLLAKADRSGELLEDVPKQDKDAYIKAAASIEEGYIIRCMRRLASALDNMSRTPDPRIELELALFDLGQHPAAAAATPHTQAKPAPPAYTAPPAPEPPASAMPLKPQHSPPPAVNAASTAAVAEPATPSAATTAAEVVEAAVESIVQPEPESSAVTVPAPSGVDYSEAGGIVAFVEWPQVLQQMAKEDRMLSSYMIDTSAFTDGVRVLIKGGNMFLTYMRENESARERIKSVIHQVSGKRYGIGPYENGDDGQAQDASTSEKNLKEWEAMGVEIQYE